MNISQLLDDLTLVADANIMGKELAFKASDYQPVKADIKKYMTFESDEALLAVFHDKQITGWFQTTSDVKTIIKDNISLNFPLLNAEFIVHSDDQNQSATISTSPMPIESVTVDYLGNGTWGLQSCVISNATASEATHIAETITQKKVKSNNVFLIYKRLWETDEDEHDAPIVKYAFFAGFTRQEKQKTQGK